MTANPIQMELVGRKIRELRRERKLTQTDLATQVGIHQSDLSRMEKGEYKVGLDTLLKILQTFNLGIGDFFEEKPHSSSSIAWKYESLDEESKKEVESFIEFKRQQRTMSPGGSEGGDGGNGYDD
ncbi:MAG: helix-turn-helix transcriptional regulator [Acidobacteria bacterium]|nr:helix-turn-helix transcriptional regulator [Acidobacteriota bacterium]